MGFFRLYNSAGMDIGYSPQVSDCILNFNIYDQDSAYYLNFSKATERTLWPQCKLSSKAKKTDLISISFMSLSNKLFVSPKLKEILSLNNTKGVQFIKSKLTIKNKIDEEYWIINPFLSDYTFLKINDCEFVYTDPMGDKILTKKKFHNIKEFQLAFEKNRCDAIKIGYPNHRPLSMQNISLLEDSDVDFFSLSPVNGGIGFFVSEKLKNEIEKAGCTGIVFTEPNEKYP